MITRTMRANAIRVLAMDAVQQANSGHPGMPMGMADIAEVLWHDFLQHNPINPKWPNRDRFVLSNGHGSMLQYALLHLSGYDLSLEELKHFRQLHSKTPGHPEYGYTPGVETTTGPLGQGFANAVGMALAEKILAAQFNQPDCTIIDHYTYVFLGDGCLMEGISHEVASLAGTLGLNKLIAFWDDNGISIDGEVKAWFTDHTPQRFEAYGWQVIADVNGHDPAAIEAAILKARQEKRRPTLICCKTTIGLGAPNKAGKEICHGAPLGEEEIRLARIKLEWSEAPFIIPEAIYEAFDARAKGQRAEQIWQEQWTRYQALYPEQAQELTRRWQGELPVHWTQVIADALAAVVSKQETIATRKASQNALNLLGPVLPELLGGSADLTGSNLTLWQGAKAVHAEDAAGNYIYYGVREFGMSAMANGLALYGGFIPYVATFLVFSDYARNALRMAAIMKQRVIFVFTHDSIGLGEDGPTHQPIEQLASLRLMPNMSLWRPCDSVESLVAWQHAIEWRKGPTSLIFSRQSLPYQKRSEAQIAAIAKGGYSLLDENNPELILLATGSEVMLAMDAAQALRNQGRRIRVVSMPCVEVFYQQDQAYQVSVLDPNLPVVAIEAGVTAFWRGIVGHKGAVIGIDRYGESAKAEDLFDYFGLTVTKVLEVANKLLIV